LDELKRCLDGGMRGVGELNPYGANLRLDHPDFLRVVEACIDFDIPLNLHINEEIGHYYPGKSATPIAHYYQLIERYPELKLILAHWGGGLLFYEIMPEVRETLRNVWYDTAASPLLFPTDAIFRTALQCIDHRKILFGSDYPLLLYPGTQNQPSFAPFLAEIDTLNLGSTVREDILGNNAARLLGLMESEEGFAFSADQSAVSKKQERVSDNTINEKDSANPFMPVQLVASTWPQTCAVFERYGIPWDDSPVPYWEPIAQAAAARGYSPTQRQIILDELNEAISG